MTSDLPVPAKAERDWPDLAGRLVEADGGRHHLLPVRVYFEDTDFSGSVYHASYLRFMERGRTDYLRLLGTDQRVLFEQTEKEAPGFAFVVRSMAIDFFKPAKFSDLLEIGMAQRKAYEDAQRRNVTDPSGADFAPAGQPAAPAP